MILYLFKFLTPLLYSRITLEISTSKIFELTKYPRENISEMSSCEFYETFKKTFQTEHLRVTDFVFITFTYFTFTASENAFIEVRTFEICSRLYVTKNELIIH